MISKELLVHAAWFSSASRRHRRTLPIKKTSFRFRDEKISLRYCDFVAEKNVIKKIGGKKKSSEREWNARVAVNDFGTFHEAGLAFSIYLKMPF